MFCVVCRALYGDPKLKYLKIERCRDLTYYEITVSTGSTFFKLFPVREIICFEHYLDGAHVFHSLKQIKRIKENCVRKTLVTFKRCWVFVLMRDLQKTGPLRLYFAMML